MKRLNDFWHLLQLFMNRIWLFHMRWNTHCQDFGRMRLLFLLLPKLEPEIYHNHNPEKFHPRDLTLIPPHDSIEFISEVLRRYRKTILYIALIICIFTLVILKLASMPIAYVISISDYFRVLIYPVMLWLLFMLVFTIHGLIKPVGQRRATWYFEYNLALHGVSRDNKIEGLMEILEQEVTEPDERIVHFKELNQKRSIEMQSLLDELSVSDKKVKKIKLLMKKNPEIIREILEKNRDIDNEERESLKELMEPKGILRDIGVNLISNIIGAVPGFFVGLTIGARK